MSDRQRTAIAPGLLYPTDVLIRDLGISKNTITQWKKKGMPFVDRTQIGSKSDYFWSNDVIEFMRSYTVKSQKAD